MPEPSVVGRHGTGQGAGPVLRVWEGHEGAYIVAGADFGYISPIMHDGPAPAEPDGEREWESASGNS